MEGCNVRSVLRLSNEKNWKSKLLCFFQAKIVLCFVLNVRTNDKDLAKSGMKKVCHTPGVVNLS